MNEIYLNKIGQIWRLNPTDTDRIWKPDILGLKGLWKLWKNVIEDTKYGCIRQQPISGIDHCQLPPHEIIIPLNIVYAFSHLIFITSCLCCLNKAFMAKLHSFASDA